jgi:hypothetical protein
MDRMIGVAAIRRERMSATRFIAVGVFICVRQTVRRRAPLIFTAQIVRERVRFGRQ